MTGERSARSWLAIAGATVVAGGERPLPPLRWSACSGQPANLPGPSGMECRRSTFEDAGRLTESSVQADVLKDGRVALMYERTYGSWVASVVAEADGPVRQALLQAGPCTLISWDIHEGKFILGVSKPNDTRTYAVLGGGVEDASIRVFLEGPYQVHRDEEDIFFVRGSSVYASAEADPESARVRALLDKDGPSGFAVDRVDMVWRESKSAPPEEGAVAVWTAKYTTDPAILHASRRRLRSDFGDWRSDFWSKRFVVGCGHAAYRTFDEQRHRGGTRIVRLSDGVSWDVFTDATPVPPIRLEKPLALTCDELFTELVENNGDRSIARIRLDSLGAGNAPD